jgi:hypothetical protein
MQAKSHNMQYPNTRHLKNLRTSTGILAGTASITGVWVVLKATAFVSAFNGCFRDFPYVLLESLLS